MEIRANQGQMPHQPESPRGPTRSQKELCETFIENARNDLNNHDIHGFDEAVKQLQDYMQQFNFHSHAMSQVLNDLHHGKSAYQSGDVDAAAGFIQAALGAVEKNSK